MTDTPKKQKPRTFRGVGGLLDHVFELAYFRQPGETIEPAIDHHWVRGRGNFVVCLGENASGKSFFRRIVTVICREAQVEAMPISMEGRGDSFGGLGLRRRVLAVDRREFRTRCHRGYLDVPLPRVLTRHLLGRT